MGYLDLGLLIDSISPAGTTETAAGEGAGSSQIVIVAVTDGPVSPLGSSHIFRLSDAHDAITNALGFARGGSVGATAMDIAEKVGETIGSARALPRASSQLMETLGRALCRLLFPDGSSIRQCLIQSLTYAAAHGHRLRLRLRVTGELVLFPWEWLYYDGILNGVERHCFLALSRDASIARYVGNVRPHPLAQPRLPVRMLVVGASPKGAQFDDIRDTIQAEFQDIREVRARYPGRVEVLFVEGENTFGKILDLLPEFRPHVLHVIAHGEQDSHGAFLAFEDPRSNLLRMTYDHLGALLTGASDLRLVVLNGCKVGLDWLTGSPPAAGSSSPVDVIHAGLATRLVLEARIPIVVAMKYAVTSGAGERFARAFYTSIFSGHAVDDAVTQACVRIMAWNQIEWGTPVTIMGSANGRVFDQPVVADDDQAEPTRPAGTDPGAGSWPSGSAPAPDDRLGGVPEETAPDEGERPHPPYADPRRLTEDLGMERIPADPPGRPFRRGLQRKQLERIVRPYQHVRNLREMLEQHLEEAVRPPLRAIEMDRFEVTNRQFAEFVEATRYRTKAERANEATTWRSFAEASRELHPVVYVTWRDAAAYCKWRSTVENREVRLPTADEWEKAARGVDGRLYPWGSVFDPSKCHTAESVDAEDTVPVTRYADVESPFGVKDLVGNVEEWADTRQGDYAVVIGGSWRTSCELYGLPVLRRQGALDLTTDDLGFRCVRPVDG